MTTRFTKKNQRSPTFPFGFSVGAFASFRQAQRLRLSFYTFRDAGLFLSSFYSPTPVLLETPLCLVGLYLSSSSRVAC